MLTIETIQMHKKSCCVLYGSLWGQRCNNKTTSSSKDMRLHEVCAGPTQCTVNRYWLKQKKKNFPNGCAYNDIIQIFCYRQQKENRRKVSQKKTRLNHYPILKAFNIKKILGALSKAEVISRCRLQLNWTSADIQNRKEKESTKIYDPNTRSWECTWRYLSSPQPLTLRA